MLPNFVPAPTQVLNASWLKVTLMNDVPTGWSCFGFAVVEDDKARDINQKSIIAMIN